MLAIYAAGQQLGISVGEVARVWEHDQYYSDDLQLEIERLLAKVGVAPTQLSGIVVYAGPGSFTGLRVAVTIANGMGRILKIGVRGVTEFDLVKKYWPGVDWVLMDSGRGEVSVGNSRGFKSIPYAELERLVTAGTRIWVDNPKLLGEIHPYIKSAGTIRIGDLDTRKRLALMQDCSVPKSYRQIEPEYGRMPNITMPTKKRSEKAA